MCTGKSLMGSLNSSESIKVQLFIQSYSLIVMHEIGTDVRVSVWGFHTKWGIGKTYALSFSKREISRFQGVVWCLYFNLNPV